MKEIKKSTNGQEKTLSEFSEEYNARLQRAMLPIPHIPQQGLMTYDARDPETKYPPIVPLRPPKGAPNVLIILIDDAGFGSSSAFGGPCQTPNIEKLAANGLKYKLSHYGTLLTFQGSIAFGTQPS